jgi:LuxR family maltose regulon positive regulatory protein
MHVGLAKLLYQWNRLAEAEVHFRQALHFAQRCGDYKMLIYGREGLADLLAAMADWEGAFAVIDALEQHVQADGPTLRRASLALRQGNLDVMTQWAARLQISVRDPLEKVLEMPLVYLELVRLHLCQRQFEGVDALLARLANIGEEQQSLSFLVMVLVCQALSRAKQGDMDTAVSIFHRALALAQPGGYIRLFLDSNDPSLVRLLHVAANNGVSANYARTILGHFGPQDGEEATAVQPLSPREMEVLHYLASGLTNRQISEEMVVSLNTVKAHTRRLYDKLAVSNRTQAVARARDLNIL